MHKLKRTTDQVRDYFSQQGCVFLDEYTHCMTPMKYICKCGREAKTSWNNFTKGKRCGYCHETGRKKKWTIEELRELYQSKGCEFLEEKYHNGHQPMRFRCRCGKEHIKSLHEFKKQPRCLDCYMASRSGENHHAWITDRELKRWKELFRKKCYKALRSSLKAIGKRKVGRTSDLLGYTPQELQDHIMKHPNWKRVKDKDWHLDHIFPIEAFVEHGITDLCIINALPNLQPILQTENNQKKDKYDKVAFKEWLQNVKSELTTKLHAW